MTPLELLLYSKQNRPQVKDEWVDAFEQMTVHTRKYKPKKLIDNLRPNEPKEIKDYRLSTHQPITHASINEAIIRAAKILNQSHYSVEASQEFEDYIV